MKIRKTGPPGKSESRDEWVYGLNPVLEAIRSGRKISSLFVSDSRKEKLDDIEKEAALRGIRIRRQEALFFDSRFPKGHQGVAALAAPRVYARVEELIDLPARGGKHLFLLLDCLEDPRNFGAILRVADAGGVDGVVIPSHRSVTLGPEAVKASAGAAEYVPVAVVSNIKHAMSEMKEKGLAVIGAEADASLSVWDVDLDLPLALVIGSEGKGLRKTVREKCDLLVSLPLKGRVNSLNAAVAAGIMVFEAIRQRMKKR